MAATAKPKFKNYEQTTKKNNNFLEKAWKSEIIIASLLFDTEAVPRLVYRFVCCSLLNEIFVPKNFAKFTGKHLLQSLLFNISCRPVLELY